MSRWPDVFTRFEAKIFPVTESGCWIWIGALDYQGYGSFSAVAKDRPIRAHRFAYATYKGPIPEGAHICHHCDIPCCVNPDHLFAGSHSDNMRDKARKGRAVQGEQHRDAKLSAEQIRSIRDSNERLRVLAARFGVGITTVWKARNRHTWRSVGKLPA